MDNVLLDISQLRLFPGAKWSTMLICSKHPRKCNPQILSRFAIRESLVPLNLSAYGNSCSLCVVPVMNALYKWCSLQRSFECYISDTMLCLWQYALLLCNSLGTPIDARYIRHKPEVVSISYNYVVAASSSVIYLWHYRTATRLERMELVHAMGRMGREGKEWWECHTSVLQCTSLMK